MTTWSSSLWYDGCIRWTQPQFNVSVFWLHHHHRITTSISIQPLLYTLQQTPLYRLLSQRVKVSALQDLQQTPKSNKLLSVLCLTQEIQFGIMSATRIAARYVTRVMQRRQFSMYGSMRSFARSFEPHPFEKLPVTQSPQAADWGRLGRRAGGQALV